MRSIVLVVHNVRSAHNVGSLLRSAEGLGVNEVYLTGYTPYPAMKNDKRLPHLAAKIDRRIAKTALGAQESVAWRYAKAVLPLLTRLKKAGYLLVALEQTPSSQSLDKFQAKGNMALIVGSEVGGLDKSVLKAADKHLEIPMRGHKESFNVSIAAAIALYHLQKLT